MKDDEDLRRIVAITAASGLAGLLVGAFRGVIQEKYGGWLGFVRGMAASIVVAVMAGLALHDADLSPTRQAAVIGLAAYVADDVLSGIVLLGQLFRNDPIGFFRSVWTSFKGGGKPP